MNVDTRSIQYSISAALNSALAKAGKQTAKELHGLVRESKRDIVKLNNEKTQAYERIVRKSRQRMMSHYKANRKSGGLTNYRNQERFSGGRMTQLIKSDALIKVRNNRIYFIDRSGLDTIAPQWYRLNFGSGNGKAAYQATGTMSFTTPTGKVLRTNNSVNFNGWGKGATNYMPSGVLLNKRFDSSESAMQGAFTRGGATSKPGFYPGYPRKPKGSRSKTIVYGVKGRMTNQIRPYSYLEAGARVINEEFGKEVSLMLDRWAKSFRRRAGSR